MNKHYTLCYIVKTALKCIFTILVIEDAQPIYAQQAPLFAWDKVYGGELWEELNGMTLLSDGILLSGSTNSFSLTQSPTHSWDMYLVKTNLQGHILWQRTYGGDQDERCWSILALKNGDILLGGYSGSGISKDKTQASQGDLDFWVIRLDANGNLLWDKTFGGTGRDEVFAMVETQDGGLLFTGNSSSPNNGDKTDPNQGNDDIWFVRTDANGNKLWDKSFGGDNREQVSSMLLTPDGAHIVAAGGTQSTANSGTLGPDAKRGGMDYLLLQLHIESGTFTWNHRYGGAQEDYAYALLSAQDGGYYLGGTSLSDALPLGIYNNGKQSNALGGRDYWLMKTDQNGLKMTNSDLCYGGNGNDILYNIYENMHGDLILGGVSNSPALTGNKTAPSRGDNDYWLVCIDKTGQHLWQTSVGSTDSDALTKIIQMPDGSYLLGGNSISNAGHEKNHNSLGGNDFWVLRTACHLKANITPIGERPPCSNEPLTLDATDPNCTNCSYSWSNGTTTPIIEVLPGTHQMLYVTIHNRNACIDIDSTQVSISEPLSISLGLRDTIIYENQTILIGIDPTDGQSYQWNTGDTTSLINVNKPGIYIVTATNSDGCTATDWIQVTTVKEDGIYIPNIFSPNHDGRDDYFNIYCNQSVRRVLTLQVFDRWGSHVFRRDNYTPQYENDGWDGTQRNLPAPLGNYVYYITVEYRNGQQERFDGIITVSR